MNEHLGTTRKIIDLLFRYRRLDALAGVCAERPCERCYSVHIPKIESKVRSGEPVLFIVPAFPAKSPNLSKVVGTLPDLAEELALEFLQSLCEAISFYHPPGAKIIICSDGHVFSDVVSVPDATVTAYRDRLSMMIARRDCLDLFCLSDVYHESEPALMRDAMVRDYPVDLEEVSRRVATEDQWRSLFNGIHRFLFEDNCALRPDATRSAIRKSAKSLAYATLTRSTAWGRLIAERFPDATRLSIHPQAAHSEKLGIQLLRAADSWLTPWHGVAVDDGQYIKLTTRRRAEALSARLVWRDGRPSHFVAPHVDAQVELVGAG
ncbi:MAG: L-tyrosine/L-tryptophan isonitrile synthase family protein [Frankia sp.]